MHWMGADVEADIVVFSGSFEKNEQK